MRASTSRESLAIPLALLFALGLSRRQSTRVPQPAGEAPEVDAVDQDVPDDRPEKVPAPDHQTAEQRAGDDGEQRPEPEGLSRSAVQQTEQHRRRRPADRPLQGAAEEQLLGEAGEERQGDRLGGSDDPERLAQPRLQLLRQGKGALGPPPRAEQQRAGAQPEGEVEPPALRVEEQRERDHPSPETDPERSGQSQREVEAPGETVETPRRESRGR